MSYTPKHGDILRLKNGNLPILLLEMRGDSSSDGEGAHTWQQMNSDKHVGGKLDLGCTRSIKHGLWDQFADEAEYEYIGNIVDIGDAMYKLLQQRK